MAKPVIVGVGDEALRRAGLGPEPAVWEDGLRTSTEPGNFEWWYFDASLDDGSTAVIVFMTKPFTQRNSPLKPYLQFYVTRPDGVKLLAFPGFPAADFKASRESCDVCLGPNWVHGDLHRYKLHVEASHPESGLPMSADLTFTGRVPPWRPGSGITYFDEDQELYFAWLPSIPYGEVEGTLTYDGLARAVRGVGYHDHNWSSVDLNKVFSHWYWGRAHVGSFSAIFSEIVCTAEYGYRKVPVFMLAQDDRLLTGDGSHLTLETGELQEHESRKSYPRRLNFRWQEDQGSAVLELSAPRIIEATSLLVTLPAWQRRLARLVANPYYFRFNADLNLSVDMPGVRALERGTALYELMILH